MARGRVSYPMGSRLPGSFGALVLFAGCALFFVYVRGTMFDSTLALVLAALSAGIAALAIVAMVNLLRHEGWEVVLAEDALELPTAPYRSTKRERFPYAAIEFVGLAPGPPEAPQMVVLHVRPEQHIRWIRQDDLVRGDVVQIARELAARVSAVRGEEVVVRRVDISGRLR